MHIHSTGHGEWPSRLAYAAALTFTLASGGTNLAYGWNKGGDLAGSLVWAAVSLGASIVFALSWPSIIAALNRKQWSCAVMALIALLLTGAYSVSAAIGSAMGGRVNAESAETTATNDRKRAQTSYTKAESELAKLGATRPVAELEKLIAVARLVCRAHVANGVRQTVCTKPPPLETELARAKERSKLQAAMDTASGELKRLGAPKVANSDAAALARYATDLGWPVDADYLNKLLVLLAVLVIECGGGLSSAVGMALSGTSAGMADSPASRGTLGGVQGADTMGGHPYADPSNWAVRESPEGEDTMAGHEADTGGRSPAGVRVLTLLRDRGGVLVGGQRAMAEALGWSKTRMNEVLHELAGQGRIHLDTRPTGTIVRLAATAA